MVVGARPITSASAERTMTDSLNCGTDNDTTCSRERAQRERMILTAARDLAEAEGWDAVTTRRLAELIEYSQPVLYSHFKGKDAIMSAVAVDGFGEIAAELHRARSKARTAKAALAAVAWAYLDFAERRPALYDAMFIHAVDLPFASPQTPAALQEAFGAMRETVRPLTGYDDLDVLTEVLWAALHGLITLMRGGRMPRDSHQRRVPCSSTASQTGPPTSALTVNL